MFLLRVRHTDPTEPQTRRRDARPAARTAEESPEVKPIFPVGPAGPADDSVRDDALDHLKAQYGDARRLLSPSGECANLDWILGAMAHSDHRSDDLNRKMTTLLSLWLEDLAVELERAPARGLSGSLAETAAAAHVACESVAASLRRAATAFVETSRG